VMPSLYSLLYIKPPALFIMSREKIMANGSSAKGAQRLCTRIDDDYSEQRRGRSGRGNLKVAIPPYRTV